MIKIVLRKFDEFEQKWIPLTEKEEREFVDEVLDSILKEHGLNASVKYVKTPKYLEEPILELE